jgi:hypothetical protein
MKNSKRPYENEDLLKRRQLKFKPISRQPINNTSGITTSVCYKIG